MALTRQKHSRPHGLVPPRTMYERTLVTGLAGVTKWVKKRIREEEGDHGTIIDGRVFAYHPTRGWRCRAAELPQPDYENLPQWRLDIIKGMFKRGVAI